MAATIEITMYYKEIISFSKIINKLDSMGYKVIVDNIEIFDDWEYTNHQVLKYNESTINLNKIISNNKITIINFTVNDFRCGYHILNIDYDIYEICVWLNTDKLSFLDNDIITNKNKYIYDNITNKLINNINSKKLLLIGIGIETLMEYDKELNNIVYGSKNIIRWIFPKDKKIDIKQHFKKEEKSSFLVYSLEEN